MFRKKYPDGTEDIVKFEDIIVPRFIAESIPNQDKIDEYTERYIKLGHIDVPITVYPVTNERGRPNKFILVNGFIRWKILKEWNEDYAPVKYQHEYI